MKTSNIQHPTSNIQFANSTDVLVEIANELKVGEDGWAQIAPLGDFPGMALIDDGKGGFKKVKAIQRIDAQAVANMVNSYAATRGGITRFLKGAPIYNGHPDIAGYEKRYPDKSPKGVFAAVKDGGEQGFIGEPIFTNEGEDLITSRKVRGLSGRWSAEEIGTENGVKIYRPKEFISAGLTDKPNLPVQLLNEAEPEVPASHLPAPGGAGAVNHNQNAKTMKQKINALLTALGLTATFANAEEPTATEQEAALDQIEKKVAAFANEKQALETKVTALTTDKTTAITERDTARTQLTGAQAQFANERKARIDDSISTAITAGRITKADEKTWRDRLAIEAQFTNELEALGKLAPALKTASVTIERGGKKVEIANEAERVNIVNELIAEEMKVNNSVTAEAAFARVEKKHPQLFAAMKRPVIKMPRK